MSRIMAISSGLPLTGKTQITVNLALELVRRGYGAGIYLNRDAAQSIDSIINIPPASTSTNTKFATTGNDTLGRRGYQGVDIFLSAVPLALLGGANREVVSAQKSVLSACKGCEVLLVDTSSMSHLETVACCEVADSIILVLTPEPQSIIEAFAMLSVLKRNKLEANVYVVCNMLDKPDQAESVFNELAETSRRYLSIEPVLLGGVLKDECIGASESNRQAFTSIYPESEVAKCILEIANSLEREDGQLRRKGRALTEFTDCLASRLKEPVRLVSG